MYFLRHKWIEMIESEGGSESNKQLKQWKSETGENGNKWQWLRKLIEAVF